MSNTIENLEVTGSLKLDGEDVALKSDLGGEGETEDLTFSAYPNADQNLTSGTWTKAAFNAEKYDSQNCFDTTNYRHTPQKSGKWRYSCHVKLDGTGITLLGVAFYKNGASVAAATFPLTSACNLVLTHQENMNGSTDYMEVMVYCLCSSGAKLSTNGVGHPAVNNFCGEYIGEIRVAQSNNRRVKFTADTTIYVDSSSGNDTTGDGSQNAPFASLQHARDYAQRNLDLAGFKLTYNCNGSFGGLTCAGALVGQKSPIQEEFSFTQGSSITNTASGGNGILAFYGAMINIRQPQNSFTITANNACLNASTGGFINVQDNISLVGNSSNTYGLLTAWGGYIITNGLTISGNFYSFVSAQGGMIQLNPNNTVNIPNNITFSKATMWAYAGGVIGCNGQTWNLGGTVTGKRYVSELNGMIATGSGENYLPGSIAGEKLSGGQYI